MVRLRRLLRSYSFIWFLSVIAARIYFVYRCVSVALPVVAHNRYHRIAPYAEQPASFNVFGMLLVVSSQMLGRIKCPAHHHYHRARQGRAVAQLHVTCNASSTSIACGAQVFVQPWCCACL